jgi:hypothetical protein
MSALAQVNPDDLEELNRVLEQMRGEIEAAKRQMLTQLESVEAHLNTRQAHWNRQGSPAGNRVIEHNLVKIRQLRAQLLRTAEKQALAGAKLNEADPLIKKAQSELKRIKETLEHYRLASEKIALGGKHWIRMAGDIGEVAGLVNMGLTSTRNLNEVKANYHLFDLISSSGIASVKTKVDRDNPIDRYEAYYDDFCRQCGTGNSALTMEDARLLQQKITEEGGLPIPQKLGNNPTEDEILAYLRDESLLAIPHDDVAGFQKWLRETKNASEETRARIISIGLTNEDIRGLRNDFFGTDDP